MPPQSPPSMFKDSTLRLESAISGAASELADLTPDLIFWHAWAEYFLYCLEEEALHLAARQVVFESELNLLAGAIQRRLLQGNWSSQVEPQ